MVVNYMTISKWAIYLGYSSLKEKLKWMGQRASNALSSQKSQNHVCSDNRGQNKRRKLMGVDKEEI